MARKTDQKSAESTTRKRRPALTPEARENQMIALAVDLAEKQLMEGTASSQVITHYLKQGTMRMKQENELLKQQTELAKAKVESIKTMGNIEKLYEEAISAMREYGGHDA